MTELFQQNRQQTKYTKERWLNMARFDKGHSRDSPVSG